MPQCWLVSSRSNFSWTWKKPDNREYRHRVALTQFIKDEPGLQEALLRCPVVCEPWKIIGAIAFEPEPRCHDVLRRLSDEEAIQYRWWVHKCLFPAYGLLTFTVTNILRFRSPEPGAATKQTNHTFFGAAPVCFRRDAPLVDSDLGAISGIPDVAWVVPHAFCSMVAGGLWRRVVVPSLGAVSSRIGSVSRAMVARDVLGIRSLKLLGVRFEPVLAPHSESRAFDITQASALAAFLQSCAPELHARRAELSEWVASLLQPGDEEQQKITLSAQRKDRVLGLLALMRVSSTLKNSKHVRAVVDHVINNVLPHSFGVQVTQSLLSAMSLPRALRASDGRFMA